MADYRVTCESIIVTDLPRRVCYLSPRPVNAGNSNAAVIGNPADMDFVGRCPM